MGSCLSRERQVTIVEAPEAVIETNNKNDGHQCTTQNERKVKDDAQADSPKEENRDI